ncbi:uncharacterized protein LOC112090804 [Morus notabilis]|uniref:uncharacterized protein LOC112090804 n=1 Tax=Morus notabilis TaxID=981085 RepID=UPI000CED4833|nr:uncharacterized protein LOC112090804 [Morus notabilis]
MKTAQSRQKSYANKCKRDLEFEVGNKVFLKVAPMKGVMRFGQNRKLNPRYIGHFEILKRVGKLAYELALPSSLSSIHGTFHVSMLCKYIADLSHVLKYEASELKPNLRYEEKLVQILDRRLKELRNKSIPLVKVLWRNQLVEEATWEKEDEMKIKYPKLFG